MQVNNSLIKGLVVNFPLSKKPVAPADIVNNKVEWSGTEQEGRVDLKHLKVVLNLRVENIRGVPR